MDQRTLQRGLRAARAAFGQGRFELVAELCSPIAFVDPSNVDAWNLFTRALIKLRRFSEALEVADEALLLAPQRAELHSTRGRALAGLGRLDASLRAHERAANLDPENAQLLLHLGMAQRRGGENDLAVETFERACRENPTLANAFHQHGQALRVAGRHDEAADAYRSAIEIRPDWIEPRNNLAITLKHVGLHRESLKAFDDALAIAPTNRTLASNRLYGLHFNSAFSRQQILEEHLKWGLSQPVETRLFRNTPDPERKLRVGYLSPDFREHCQRFFTLPLLKNHDRDRFEIVCYHDARISDPFTDRIRSLSNQWFDVSRDTDRLLAERIVNDQIDVLVDLTQHMANNRLPTLNHRPAPVQLSWLGYPAPTGSPAIDFRISDPRLDPLDHTQDPTLHLPDAFWCYDPLCDLPASSLPADQDGHITFGCLNNFCKVTDVTLSLWSRIFARLCTARLILLVPAGSARSRVIDGLQIDPHRITFVDHRERTEYLKAFHQIDICLDTFPYNGHTTSLDALWMGVPVVSLFGQTTVSRAGLSLAYQLGLDEWVTDQPEEFVNIAISAAGQLSRLTDLRRSLRERLQNSPLMNAPRFAKNMEVAYRTAWRGWCAVQQAL